MFRWTAWLLWITTLVEKPIVVVEWHIAIKIGRRVRESKREADRGTAHARGERLSKSGRWHCVIVNIRGTRDRTRRRPNTMG
jgi:hypothetical protein